MSAAAALAQNTCFTNPEGTSICSSPEAVIHGGTDSTGHSIYRDDRGNELDFETDQFGNSSVQVPSGKSINWSQPVLGERKYPSFQGYSPPPPIAVPMQGAHPPPSPLIQQPR